MQGAVTMVPAPPTPPRPRRAAAGGQWRGQGSMEMRASKRIPLRTRCASAAAAAATSEEEENQFSSETQCCASSLQGECGSVDLQCSATAARVVLTARLQASRDRAMPKSPNFCPPHNSAANTSKEGQPSERLCRFWSAASAAAASPTAHALPRPARSAPQRDGGEARARVALSCAAAATD
eukprot:363353-Chlamydomonas_euryale.AAC.21